MADYRILVPQLAALLAPDGIAMVEIGWQQGEAVAGLARSCGLAPRIHPDLAGRDRAVEIAVCRNISLGKGADGH